MLKTLKTLLHKIGKKKSLAPRAVDNAKRRSKATGHTAGGRRQTVFPGIMWLMPAPQWHCVLPEDLDGKEIAALYRKDIPGFVPQDQRMWALENSALFTLLEQNGGWQAYFLPAYEVCSELATKSIMDVLIELRSDPVAQRYWQSLSKHSNVPYTQMMSISDAESVAEQYPLLWRHHLDGLRWVERFFSRHYRKSEDQGVTEHAA